MQTLKVAAVQMVSSSDWQYNLQRAEVLVGQAAADGAKLVCLPENFATFGVPDYLQLAAQEQTAAGPVRQHMAALAARLNIYLLAGSLPVLDDVSGKCLASSFLYGDNGQEIARYNKVHLFDALVNDAQGVYRESDQYQHGDRSVCVATAIGHIGLAICYDLRFPELFQQLCTLQANIIMLPAAFTRVTGQKHWEILLRARAVETQCYVIASNQGGRHSDTRQTWGHSMIVSPDGDILAEAADGEAVVMAELDLATQDQLRQRMPLWQHKRL